MFQFFPQIWKGIKVYGDAIRFIIDNRLYVYFIAPAILSAGIWWGAYLLEQKISQTTYHDVDSLRELLVLLIRNLFWTSIVLMGYKLRKYIVFVVLSPLLSRLSLRTEEIITGNTYKITWEQYKNDIKRAIRIAMGNFIIEYSIFAAWYVFVLFIPDANILTPGFLLLVGCYFYGFCLIDYVNERRRLNIAESVRFIRENAGFSFGVGLVFSLLFFIPLDLGVLVAPVLGIVAATIGMHYLVDLSKNKFATSAETIPASQT